MRILASATLAAVFAAPDWQAALAGDEV